MTRALKDKRILITCGPTWVPIDDVRVMSNISTGEMGQKIAAACAKEGARVILLEGAVQRPTAIKGVEVIPFRFFNELQRLLRKELKKNVSIVIHAAAVSDYRPRRKISGKISSRQKKISLPLVRTPKLIRAIKEMNPDVVLVGFKLAPNITRPLLKQATRELFRKSGCDLVVANSVDDKHYRGYIQNKQGTVLAQSQTRSGIARALTSILRKSL